MTGQNGKDLICFPDTNINRYNEVVYLMNNGDFTVGFGRNNQNN